MGVEFGWRVASLLSIGALLVVGCGDGDSAPQAPTPQALASSDEVVVRNYVEALDARDLQTARTFQCTEKRIDDKDLALYADQLDRLLDYIGPISVVAVDPVPSSGLAQGGDGSDPQEVQIRLASRGGSEGSPLVAVLITQDGERRVCGRATPQTAGMILRREHPDLVDLGEPEATLDALMPTIERDGYRVVVDEATAPVPGDGVEWTEGWERIWRTGEYGGVTAWAGKYSSPRAARESLGEQISEFFPDAVATFGIPDIEGAVGVRYLGFAGLGIQPPSEGPYIDRLYIQMGDVVIDLAVSALPTGSTHDVIQELAAQVLENAGKPPNGSRRQP